MMNKEKTENTGLVETVSRFVGVCVGSLVVGGREMAGEVKEITKPKTKTKTKPAPKPKAGPGPTKEPILIEEPGPKATKKVAEKSAVSASEKKSGPTTKKKKTSRKAKVKKK